MMTPRTRTDSFHDNCFKVMEKYIPTNGGA